MTMPRIFSFCARLAERYAWPAFAAFSKGQPFVMQRTWFLSWLSIISMLHLGHDIFRSSLIIQLLKTLSYTEMFSLLDAATQSRHAAFCQHEREGSGD
ncbi:MAG: hypothetical protein KBE09_05510 [Candidatus Pacebacteria bacterium]|nr:hypothetical protein [Candidatus Paceibacterota bacterium]